MGFTVASQRILDRKDLERTKGIFKVTLEIENPKEIERLIRSKEDFVRRAEAIFLRYVFQVHKYLIRLTPADTGRLRAGWTSILDKYNQSYERQFFDTALYDVWKTSNKTPEATTYKWDPAAIGEGKGLSDYQDTPFNIMLINNVSYGEIQEFGSSKLQGRHFLELARYKAELWFPVIFNSWFAKIEKEGKIVDLDIPDDQLEIDN